MPHITVDKNLPGIRSLMAFRPETAKPLSELAEVLLRDHTGLSPTERELIATYVSYLNDCFYCHHSHGAIASCYLGGDQDLVNAVCRNYKEALVSEKLKALLQIAGKVQKGGKAVLQEDIDNARLQGATDRDIHDTVLIAAAFCMFNRYVDGLASVAPQDLSTYPLRAQQIVENGYGSHIYTNPQPTK
ncbi:MAG: peroxidase-related enzyme [Bacteroidota bacterium]|nr:peroxidase-related enzyme [Bacteroidota bacterium]